MTRPSKIQVDTRFQTYAVASLVQSRIGAGMRTRLACDFPVYVIFAMQDPAVELIGAVALIVFTPVQERRLYPGISCGCYGRAAKFQALTAARTKPITNQSCPPRP